MFVCLPFLPLSSIAHTRIADSTPLAKLGEHNKDNCFIPGWDCKYIDKEEDLD